MSGDRRTRAVGRGVALEMGDKVFGASFAGLRYKHIVMRGTVVRQPAVAGLFYPGDAASVAAGAKRLVARVATNPLAALAAVCPHAGWQYSGALAGRLAAAIVVPQRVLVIAPNHTGRGVRGSVWPEGTWRLPGLDVAV